MKVSARRISGFTLIETLIALVVAATAAAVAGAMLHAMFARAEKQREHTESVTALLNGSVRTSLADWRTGLVRVESGNLRISTPGRDSLGDLMVHNHAAGTAVTLPPVTVAYTPVQRFCAEQGIFMFCFLAPGLPPPEGWEPPSSRPTGSTAPQPSSPTAAGGTR